MFNPTRDQARQFFFTTWHKFQHQQTLTDLERLTLKILKQHPEYHPMLDNPEAWQHQDWPPEWGETNPFLHLSMHLAIEEQLSIDQPRGLKALYQRFLQQYQDDHPAQHEVMDGLAEMIWQAQRHHTPPNPEVYLSALRRKLGLATDQDASPSILS